MTHHTGHTGVGGEDKFTLVPSMSVSQRDVRTHGEHTKRARAIFNRAGPHKRKQNRSPGGLISSFSLAPGYHFRLKITVFELGA